MKKQDKKLKVSSAYGGVGITLKIGHQQIVLDYNEVVKLKEVIDAKFHVQLKPQEVHEIVGTKEESSFEKLMAESKAHIAK